MVLCADESQSDVFYLFEVYRDSAALDANSRAPWFGQYMAAVGPLLAGQTELVRALPLLIDVKDGI